jgi:hypothetical protein
MAEKNEEGKSPTILVVKRPFAIRTPREIPTNSPGLVKSLHERD